MSRWDIDLPSGADPGNQTMITTINPHDKYERKVGLNYKEYSDFAGICSLHNDQIIRCYHWLDKDVIWEELVLRCRDCPYAMRQSRSKWKTYYFHDSNRYPWFIDKIVEIEWDNPKNYVYFISDGQFVKIGVAKNPESRLKELQTGNPRKLSIMCKIPVGSDRDAYRLEGKLHIEYEAFAKQVEWFNILDYIKQQDFIERFGECEE